MARRSKRLKTVKSTVKSAKTYRYDYEYPSQGTGLLDLPDEILQLILAISLIPPSNDTKWSSSIKAGVLETYNLNRRLSRILLDLPDVRDLKAILVWYDTLAPSQFSFDHEAPFDKDGIFHIHVDEFEFDNALQLCRNLSRKHPAHITFNQVEDYEPILINLIVSLEEIGKATPLVKLPLTGISIDFEWVSEGYETDGRVVTDLNHVHQLLQKVSFAGSKVTLTPWPCTHCKAQMPKFSAPCMYCHKTLSHCSACSHLEPLEFTESACHDVSECTDCFDSMICSDCFDEHACPDCHQWFSPDCPMGRHGVPGNMFAPLLLTMALLRRDMIELLDFPDRLRDLMDD